MKVILAVMSTTWAVMCTTWAVVKIRPEFLGIHFMKGSVEEKFQNNREIRSPDDNLCDQNELSEDIVVSRQLLVCFDILTRKVAAHVNVMNQGWLRQDVVTPSGAAGLRYARGALVTSSDSAIAIWRTTAVTLFAIYRHSSNVIETDMNIITCFTRKECIVDFKSRKFR